MAANECWTAFPLDERSNCYQVRKNLHKRSGRASIKEVAIRVVVMGPLGCREPSGCVRVLACVCWKCRFRDETHAWVDADSGAARVPHFVDSKESSTLRASESERMVARRLVASKPC